MTTTEAIIDLQLACENTDNLPTEAQLQTWASAAIQPKKTSIEMYLRVTAVGNGVYTCRCDGHRPGPW